MAKKAPWLNVDDYLKYQPPNTDRSTWTKSNKFAYGSDTFKGKEWPKRELDFEKCEVCGGAGRIYQLREDLRGNKRGIKRNIPCPKECEYTIHW